MSKVQSVRFMLVLWAVLFGGSLVLRAMAGASGTPDGAIGHGLAVVAAQLMAAMAAVICWRFAGTLHAGHPMRRVGQVPLAVTLLVLCYLLWSVLGAAMRGRA
ncbi:hypothetical protein [Szabonella alba]|uniref:Transmembrane protein n=1 Tax=Szabonella alba TaxID=2804194 RepID=A0A8K0V5A2_9RHOB|nr:hypothetical protein [Szabonella alba]MBL4916059.1 hypothetical protein [Szabonella alba]